MTSHVNPRDSLFESIRLSSTVGNGKTSFPQSSTSRLAADLESTSGTSDDEDLDPTEFLSSQSPEMLKQADNKETLQESEIVPEPEDDLILTDRNPSKATSPESVLTETIHHSFDTPDRDLGSVISNMNMSEFKVPHEKSDSQAPLQHLQQNYNNMINELHNNVKLHRSALESGNDSLAKIRARCVESFHNLSENQYALHELYERESSYNSAMCKRFKKWDQKRNRILEKIKSIKSPKNSHGAKLMTLLDENSVLDQEIAELEARLVMLKAKKKILHSEISDTSSVLESKSSKYVKAFQELDRNGYMTILETLKQNGLTNDGAVSLIRTTPVDVTFVQHYEQQRSNDKKLVDFSRTYSSSQDIKLPKKEPEEKIVKDTNTNKTPQTHTSLGIQAYEIPQTFNDSSTPSNLHQADGAETDAYHKGFSTGYKQSEKFKHQLQKIFESYIKPLLEQKETERKSLSPNIDDDENTITDKVDLGPVIDFLQHKVVAYSELSTKSGMMSTVYHKYSDIWNDTCYSIETKEKELEYTIMDKRNEAEADISVILAGILDNLVEAFRMSNKIHQSPDNALSMLIKQEADGLIKALSMIPEPYSKKKDQYAQKFTLEVSKLDKKSDFKDISNAVMESDSHSSYLYNVNSNAIEHKIINNKPKNDEVVPVTRTSSKQVKGE